MRLDRESERRGGEESPGEEEEAVMERRRFEVNARGVDRKVGAEKENVVVVAWRAIVGEIRKMRLGDAFLFFLCV